MKEFAPAILRGLLALAAAPNTSCWAFHPVPFLSPLRSLPSVDGSVLSSSSSSSETTSSTTLSIEYCTGCRWMLKSFWMAQELLTTFEQDLDATTVCPSNEKGMFAIHLHHHDEDETLPPLLLWDRKTEGGFPQPKELKQRVRDEINPTKFLGHSDTVQRQEALDGAAVLPTTGTEMERYVEESPTNSQLATEEAPTPNVSIHYCTGCNWLLRAAYFGQELLTTFADGEIASVTLIPSRPPAKGGRFSLYLDGNVLFDRSTEGRFPEVKEIKQLIRDVILPDKGLGHSDAVKADEMGDDEADDARKFFGVL